MTSEVVMSLPKPAATQQQTGAQTKAKRLASIDIVRGLAMVFMLTVHSASRVPDFGFRTHWGWNAPEFAITEPLTWLGLIFALATPAFFILAGFGIMLFENARRRKGWTEWQITRYLLIRGAILIFLDLVILPWRIPELDFWPHRYMVLLPIGMSLWTIAFIRRLDWRWLLAIATGLTVVTQIIYNVVPMPEDANLIRAALLYPSPVETMKIGFPYFAWMPIMLFGYLVMGYLYTHRENFSQITMRIGVALLATWALITLGNGFGVHYHDHPLVVTKHPPMLDYLTFYLGWVFVLLSVFHGVSFLQQSWPGRKLAVLGQTALFFYVVHEYVYIFVNPVLNRITPLEDGALALGIAAVSLVILYFMSYYYRALRKAHPNSVLQYL